MGGLEEVGVVVDGGGGRGGGCEVGCLDLFGAAKMVISGVGFVGGKEVWNEVCGQGGRGAGIVGMLLVGLMRGGEGGGRWGCLCMSGWDAHLCSRGLPPVVRGLWSWTRWSWG